MECYTLRIYFKIVVKNRNFLFLFVKHKQLSLSFRYLNIRPALKMPSKPSADALPRRYEENVQLKNQ